jgi:hypothetical protein
MSSNARARKIGNEHLDGILRLPQDAMGLGEPLTCENPRNFRPVCGSFSESHTLFVASGGGFTPAYARRLQVR